MAERGTEQGSNYQTRPIDPTQVIPGTYYAPEARGSFQLCGKDHHNVQVNFDPTTKQVQSIWVSPGWFIRSENPISGDLYPKDMRVEVTLDEQTQEPTQVGLVYDPSAVEIRYSGHVYLDVVPFVEEQK